MINETIAQMAGYAAGILSLAGYIPYTRAILRGETRPNRASWIIWLVVNVIISASYREIGAVYAFLLPVAYTIGALLVVVLSWKYGVGGWTPFDRYCLLGAGIGLILWVVFKSPLIALLINLSIDILGTLPTLRKVYFEPQTEDAFAWVLYLLGTLIGFFAVEGRDFALWIYPVSLVLINGSVTVLVLFPGRKWKAAPPDGEEALSAPVDKTQIL